MIDGSELTQIFNKMQQINSLMSKPSNSIHSMKILVGTGFERKLFKYLIELELNKC